MIVLSASIKESFTYNLIDQAAWNATLFLSRVRKPQTWRAISFFFFFCDAVIFRETWWKQKALWLDLIEDRVIAEIMSSTEQKRTGEERGG